MNNTNKSTHFNTMVTGGDAIMNNKTFKSSFLQQLTDKKKKKKNQWMSSATRVCRLWTVCQHPASCHSQPTLPHSASSIYIHPLLFHCSKLFPFFFFYCLRSVSVDLVPLTSASCCLAGKPLVSKSSFLSVPATFLTSPLPFFLFISFHFSLIWIASPFIILQMMLFSTFLI